MKALLALLLLAGCAAPACKVIKITETKTVTETAPPRFIIIHDRPVHAALLNNYAQTLAAERPVVLKAKTPAVIDKLTQLNIAARAAFAPIQKPHHRATPAEMANAISALAAMQACVKLQACVTPTKTSAAK